MAFQIGSIKKVAAVADFRGQGLGGGRSAGEVTLEFVAALTAMNDAGYFNSEDYIYSLQNAGFESFDDSAQYIVGDKVATALLGNLRTAIDKCGLKGKVTCGLKAEAIEGVEPDSKAPRSIMLFPAKVKN